MKGCTADKPLPLQQPAQFVISSCICVSTRPETGPVLLCHSGLQAQMLHYITLTCCFRADSILADWPSLSKACTQRMVDALNVLQI